MKMVPLLLVLSLTVACTKGQPATSVGQGNSRAEEKHGNGTVVTASAMTPIAAQVPASSGSPSPATSKMSVTEKTEGPFPLGNQSYTFVKRILSIEQQPHNPDDETVDWWELRDNSGAPVYHQSYGPVTVENGSFRETTSVDARILKTKFGQGLVVEGMELPSAPNTGSWVQVFGIVNGKLVPFGAPISTNGEFQGEATDSFTPSVMIRGQQPQKIERDVLNFKVWAGDFSIIYPVQVDWMSIRVRPAWRCLRTTAHGPIKRCRYKIEVEPHRVRKDLTFVRLFREPEEGFGTPGHVVIKPESKIEYLEAEVAVQWDEQKSAISIGVPGEEGDVWLHVKIDGQDGWIHTEEDLQAVGLEQSG